MNHFKIMGNLACHSEHTSAVSSAHSDTMRPLFRLCYLRKQFLDKALRKRLNLARLLLQNRAYTGGNVASIVMEGVQIWLCLQI